MRIDQLNETDSFVNNDWLIINKNSNNGTYKISIQNLFGRGAASGYSSGGYLLETINGTTLADTIGIGLVGGMRIKDGVVIDFVVKITSLPSDSMPIGISKSILSDMNINAADFVPSSGGVVLQYRNGELVSDFENKSPIGAHGSSNYWQFYRRLRQTPYSSYTYYNGSWSGFQTADLQVGDVLKGTLYAKKA